MNFLCLTAFVACGGNSGPEVTDVCGDGIVGATEACDDGNAWFADGCTPSCIVEDGPVEEEPNDAWNEATAWPGAPFVGSLPEGDVDCVSFDVESCGAVRAQLIGECPRGVVLALHDPDGVQVATGTEGLDGCSVIDPSIAPGARFMVGPTAAVCASSLLGNPIPGYTLDIETVPSTDLGSGGENDLDDDGAPDRCDDDRDGDGVLDEADNCPTLPNGPTTSSFSPNAEGFLQQWLAIGPIAEIESPEDCLPSFDEREGGDAGLAPTLGQPDGELAWNPFLTDNDRLSFNGTFGFEPAPRVVYVHTQVISDRARDLTLSVGADDGVRAWLEGQVVLEVASCQGTVRDQFQAPVSLIEGVNRLTIKVRDNGGGWGLFVRFLDDLGAPVTDLDVSLSPDGMPLPSQSDADGDGIGDLCDSTPAG